LVHKYKQYLYVLALVSIAPKAYYQAFFRVLIDLIVELFGLIIKPFDNQTEILRELDLIIKSFYVASE
jgi:hypothetical protein